MRTLLTLALMLLAVQPQEVITARRRAHSGGPCTPSTTNMTFGFLMDSCVGTSPSTLTDVSGNSNTATAVSAAPCTASQINGHAALVMTGGGSWYQLATPVCTSNPCTVYFTFNAVGSGASFFLVSGSGTGNNSYALQMPNPTAKIELDQQVTALIATSTPSLTLSTWQRGAFSCSGSGTVTCTLYIEGVSVGSGSAAVNISNGIDFIGARSAAGSDSFEGSIASIYGYSAAYSSTTDTCVSNQIGGV